MCTRTAALGHGKKTSRWGAANCEEACAICLLFVRLGVRAFQGLCALPFQSARLFYFTRFRPKPGWRGCGARLRHGGSARRVKMVVGGRRAGLVDRAGAERGPKRGRSGAEVRPSSRPERSLPERAGRRSLSDSTAHRFYDCEMVAAGVCL